MSTPQWFAEFEREDNRDRERREQINGAFREWDDRRFADLEAALIEAMHCA